MNKFVIGAFILMLILHQDVWAWSDDSLVLGMLPAALAYHAFFSICCALLGLAAIRYAWPHELEKLTEESDSKDS